MVEIWKPVVGWEGLYEVSNQGRVRSLDREVPAKVGTVIRKGRLLSQRITPFGYIRVKLTRDKQSKYYMVHRLVGEAFLSNPDNLPFINHKDENKKNNTVYLNPDGSVDFSKSNLEWCTRLYNARYGTNIERIRTSHINNPKLSKKVAKCSISGEIIEIYPSQAEAARKNGLFQSRISNCCIGKPKCVTHGGYKWRFI